MTLWRDLVDIPDHQERWVLNLNDGLRDDQRAQTVANYIVTDSLQERFRQALEMLQAGLGLGAGSRKESRGAFLHGSFGSGKSHFMAILELLLEGYTPARQLDHLTPVVTDHGWMDDVELLHIPFHMIGADSMEQAVFSRYVDWVETHHPDAQLPALYESGPILENAERLREMIGDDDRFLRILNGDETAPNGGSRADAGGLEWGEVVEEADAGWTLDSYRRAADADPRSPEHRDLLSNLIEHVLPVVSDLKGATGQGFVGFDEGLARLSRHAHDELDYDGVLFFLDELVLWLSREGADTNFVNRELQKVVKLVESEHADRPAPIFSFIARQKNLSEMLGSAVEPEDSRRIHLSEDYIEKRFEDIRLQDRNLPYVASKRLLDPTDDRASEQIRQSFASTFESLDADQRDVILTGRYNREDFERIYPFSPALVQALVVLSNELQRERTALNIMQRILIEQRNQLELGDVVPIGDLWPHLETGEEPSDPARKKLFQSAKNLRRDKLIPYLEREHDVDDWEQLEPDDSKWQPFRDDLRLMHTLLVSALVPKLQIFENLDAERLMALNRGVAQTPLPGARGALSQIRTKLRTWSSEITEIHYSDSPSESIELRLEGVDIEHILDKAADRDSRDARRRTVKELLFEWLELDAPEGLDLRTEHRFDWRGDTRTLEVAYCNVRKRNSDQMEPTTPEHGLLMIDYPFDAGNYGPLDDERRLEAYHEERGYADTLAWLPHHLTSQGRKLLSRLVRIETVLGQFSAYTEDLPPRDRPIAKSTLERDREAIEDRLRRNFMTAYGLKKGGDARLVDTSTHIDAVQSLVAGHDPTLHAGQRFDEVLDDLGGDLFRHTYPASPDLPHRRLQPREVARIHEIIRTSIDSGEGAHVKDERMRRRLARYAEPLDLGEMGDNRFSHSRAWSKRIERQLQPDEEGLAVGDVFDVIDPPDDPRGLADELRDLVVLVYADLEDMLVERRGRALDDPTPGDLRADDRLAYYDLPDEETWERACALAADVFGFQPPRSRNSRSVQRLARDLEDAVGSAVRRSARQLADLVRRRATDYLGFERDDISGLTRWQVADALESLMGALDEQEAGDRIEAVGDVTLEGTNRDGLNADERSMLAKSLECAPDNVDVLNDTRWFLFDKLVRRVDDGDDMLADTLGEARELIAVHERAKPLSRLENLEQRVGEALIDSPDPPDRGGGGSGHGHDEDDDGDEDETPSTVRETLESDDLESLREQFGTWLEHHVDRTDGGITVNVELDIDE